MFKLRPVKAISHTHIYVYNVVALLVQVSTKYVLETLTFSHLLRCCDAKLCVCVCVYVCIYHTDVCCKNLA